MNEGKYQIVDSTGKQLTGARLANKETGHMIPEDEPIFILRGRDKHTVPTIADYWERCNESEHAQAVHDRLCEIETWQNDNRAKLKEPG